MKIINQPIFYFLIVALLVLSACKKFVSVPFPNDQLSSDQVFQDSSTAISAITGIYSQMAANANRFSDMYTTLLAGLSADELYCYTPSQLDEFYKNQLTGVNENNIDNGFWIPAYQFIYSANLALEKLAVSTALSIKLNNQLSGEAKLIRAYCYFQLVNLFGDVPLIISSDYQTNASISRTASAKIYRQIVSDLLDAELDLTDDYPTGEKVRPNKWTARSFLSKVYLYTGNWQQAFNESSAVIASGQYSLEPDLNQVFLKNSKEAIWQLMPVRPNYNTFEGLTILPASPYSLPTYLLTDSMVAAFEHDDHRKTCWVQSRVYGGLTLFYPYKYKVYTGTLLTEYYMLFRLAEQYLIRAEAASKLNRITLALADLNIIRQRAGLQATLATDTSNLNLLIEQERRIELFAEWGHRWYDLKRTGRINEVLSKTKTSAWQSTASLWPIPQVEINLNPALKQNPGY